MTIQLASKQMKRCSILLAIRKVQIKIIMRYPIHIPRQRKWWRCRKSKFFIYYGTVNVWKHLLMYSPLNIYHSKTSNCYCPPFTNEEMSQKISNPCPRLPSKNHTIPTPTQAAWWRAQALNHYASLFVRKKVRIYILRVTNYIHVG